MNLTELRHAIESELRRGRSDKEISLALKAAFHELPNLSSVEWQQRIAELAASHYLFQNPNSDK